MKKRKSTVERKSKETDIVANLSIDGEGKAKINTQIGILDHMIELFAFHGFFDLQINVKKADTNVDIHHTNEDVGIVLGKTFKDALGDKIGIRRFGAAMACMEATVARVVIDISGRGFFKFNKEQKVFSDPGVQDGYALSYLDHFLESFAHALDATMNLKIENVSNDLHTNLEAVFKALGMALDQATQIDPRRKGIPSTKGIID
ncbi:MAG: imidazoleglycerol-phosphate dehydratase [Candidatus Omnitrophota bacterium]